MTWRTWMAGALCAFLGLVAFMAATGLRFDV